MVNAQSARRPGQRPAPAPVISAVRLSFITDRSLRAALRSISAVINYNPPQLPLGCSAFSLVAGAGGRKAVRARLNNINASAMLDAASTT